jgi:hypothetical protein
MSAMARQQPVTRRDIEAKLRQIRGEVEETTETARSYAMVVGAAGLVVVVAAVYLLGRRRGRKRSTVVEVLRV